MINKKQVFYKIKWIDYSKNYNEWISEKNMKKTKKLWKKYD